MKEQICSSYELKCVEEVEVDSPDCLPPCQGSFITSFSRFEKDRNLEYSILKEIIAYDKMMKWNPNPPILKGKFTGFSLKCINFVYVLHFQNMNGRTSLGL